MAEKSSEINITDLAKNDTEIENRNEDIDSNDAAETDDSAGLEVTSEDTEQIRSQIEDTRRGMGETIDAIQEKLSFSNVSEQVSNISDHVKEQVSEQITNAVETAKDAVYEATIGKAGNIMEKIGKELKRSNIIKTAGENPLPFILIGLGAGLLLFKTYGKKSTHKFKGAGFSGKSGKSNKNSLLKSAQGKVSDAAGTAYEGVSSAAGTAYDSVTNAASTAYKGVGDATQSVYEKTGDLGTQVREKYDYYLEENPLVVGAVAAALGIAVGLAVPSTNYENNLLGETHENLMSKAEDVTRQAFEKVQQVAGDVGKSITGEENSQNPT